jgi:hypothetical protein
MKKALLLLVFLAACGTPEPKKAAAPPPAPKPAIAPPSAEAAQQLLAASPEFSDYQFTNASVTVPLNAPMPAYMEDDAKQLAAAGWLRKSGGGFELTEKAKGDKRFLVRPNGYADVVPLAKKELTGVTAVRPNPDGTVDAAFNWKWLPNEVGAAFTRGPVHDRYAAPQKATAKLMWDGSTWTVLRITP